MTIFSFKEFSGVYPSDYMKAILRFLEGAKDVHSLMIVKDIEWAEAVSIGQPVGRRR